MNPHIGSRPCVCERALATPLAWEFWPIPPGVDRQVARTRKRGTRAPGRAARLGVQTRHFGSGGTRESGCFSHSTASGRTSASRGLVLEFGSGQVVDLPKTRAIIAADFTGRPRIGNTAAKPMCKGMQGLGYTAALVAMLHACVIAHVIHPLFHARADHRPVVASSAAQGGCGPTCACSHNRQSVSRPSVERAGFDCPICRFLLHHPPQTVSAGTSWAPYEVSQEKSADLDLAVYVFRTYSSANARAPPSCA
jgi:hypothetical protein